MAPGVGAGGVGTGIYIFVHSLGTMVWCAVACGMQYAVCDLFLASGKPSGQGSMRRHIPRERRYLVRHFWLPLILFSFLRVILVGAGMDNRVDEVYTWHGGGWWLIEPSMATLLRGCFIPLFLLSLFLPLPRVLGYDMLTTSSHIYVFLVEGATK
jgi:hypothetical protein